MKNISIIFSKHQGFNIFSTLIMWGLKTPFSHVAIKMQDGDTKQNVYYQASGLDINCVSEAQFLSAETIVYQKDIQASDNVFIKGKTASINKLGEPYSILAILGFALQITLGTIHINISNPFRNDGSQFVCSQFAGYYIEQCENTTLDITNMTPKALYEIIPTISNTWI